MSTVTLVLTTNQAQLLEDLLGQCDGMMQDVMQDEVLEGKMTQDGADRNLIDYGKIMGGITTTTLTRGASAPQSQTI